MFTAQPEGYTTIGKIRAGAGCQADGVLLTIPVDHLPAGVGRGELEFSFGQAGAGALGAFLLYLNQALV